MDILSVLKQKVNDGLHSLYGSQVDEKQIQLQNTRREFEGDFTVVVFPFLRLSKKAPEATANDLGEYLKENVEEVESFNVIKGFLNIQLSNAYWLGFLNSTLANDTFGFKAPESSGKSIMVEYSSPNTNKPLHLGHIRNNLLGYSVSELLKANGHKVHKVNLVNDRGIHICKSMLAWQKWGNGETPESAGIKGDKLVGNYYVKFDQEYKKEMEQLVNGGMDKDEAKEKATLIQEAREMLRKWEAGDAEVNKLWAEMNGWVYKGFDITYNRLGIDFDKIYYESETYKLGKKIVLEGLEKGILIKKEDGSVWADLTGEGLDQKILLRSDGTSVYMTQDIGTAHQRFSEFTLDNLLYVVGNEQNYHFQVLKIVLEKLGYNWAKNIEHLSYGMVELPEGKMKSREGTVVDADDLMQEMVNTARETSEELGKMAELGEEEAANVFEMVGLGALKYFILKVDPKKTMMFNPQESIDFNGNTGPFIQYTHARIKSVLRKAADADIEIPEAVAAELSLSAKEMGLIKMLFDFPAVVEDAGNNYSPAVIANYIYDLAKDFNQFYHDHSMVKETNEAQRAFRLVLASKVAATIKNGAALLGMNVPERM